MLPNRTSSLCKQLFMHVLVLVNVLLLSDTGGTRFLGPLMCQLSCEATLGCSSYGFSEDHLICRVLLDHENIKDPSGGWTIREHSRKGDAMAHAALNRTCVKYSRIFYSRAGSLSCGSDKTVQTNHKAGMLLFTRSMSRKKSPLFHFNLQNTSLSKYQNLTLKDVKAMCYVAAMRRVILSLAGEFKLSYVTLDTNTIKTIKKNIVCTAISVDLSRGLLVIAQGHPMSALYTITPDGENYKFLFNISNPKRNALNYPSALAVDPKRKCVYVCLKQSILSVALEGKTVDVLYRSSFLQGMGLDPVEDVLYFGRKHHVIKTSLGTNRTTKVAYVDGLIFNMLYYDNYIYTSSYFSKSIISLDVKSNTKTRHKISFKGTTITILMCVIP